MRQISALLEHGCKQPDHVEISEEVLNQSLFVLCFEALERDFTHRDLMLLLGHARVVDLPLHVALVDLLSHNRDVVEEQLLQVVALGICCGRSLANLRLFTVKKLFRFLLLFFDQLGEILNLVLTAWHLIRTEVVVDLAAKNIIRQAQRAHLLKEILNFYEVELFKRLS